jgi:hypothetical protein
VAAKTFLYLYALGLHGPGCSCLSVSAILLGGVWLLWLSFLLWPWRPEAENALELIQ